MMIGAAGVLAWLLMAGAGWTTEPRPSPAQPEPKGEMVERVSRGLLPDEGAKTAPVTAKVTTVSARADWKLDKKGQWKESKTVTAMLVIDDARAYVAQMEAALTEVIDRSGVNLVVEQPPAKPRQDERSVLEQKFWLMLRSRPSARAPMQAVGHVSELPKAYERVAGHLECVMADLVKEDLEPKVMDEAIEIVPGVTFLWTKVQGEAKEGMYAYEVRVRREKGEKAGMEPIFAGVMLEDDQGRVVMQWQNQQRVDTASEYLYLGHALPMPKAMRDRVKAWNVSVFDNLRVERFEFEARDLKVAPPRGGDWKPIMEGPDANGE